MSLLDRQIGRARKRLTNNILLERLSVGVLLAAGLWGLTVLVVRLFALGVPLWHGAWMAALLAVLIALIAAAVARPSALQAAVALDGAAGLKERLSTALVVRRQTDPFVRAAVKDAEQVAGRIHVPSHIRYRAPALWPWSLAATVAALILAWFMPTVNLLAGQPADKAPVPQPMVKAEQEVIKTEFEQQMSKIKELANENPAIDDLLKGVEAPEMPEGPTVTPDDVRRDAVRCIDDVRDRLRKGLEESEEAGLKKTERMFQQLNEPGNKQSSDQLSQTLASGDFEGAKEALKDLAQQIEEAAKNADDPESRQKLAEMQEQLKQLSDRLTKLSDTVKLQQELENKAGMSEEEAKKLLNELLKMDPKQLAKELQKRLADKGVSPKQIQELTKKVQQQQQAKKTCQNMSKALSKAAQACQQCQSPSSSGSGAAQAASALSDAASQLSELEMSEQTMKEIEARLSELDDMRDNVCQGKMCPGDRPGDGRQSQIGSQGPNARLGLGQRIGKELTPYERKPIKAPTRFQGGTVVGRMLVEGPQVRGQATAEEMTAVNSELRDALDAVEREEVPRQYQPVLRAYFERLAGLLREQQTPAEKPAAATQP